MPVAAREQTVDSIGFLGLSRLPCLLQGMNIEDHSLSKGYIPALCAWR